MLYYLIASVSIMHIIQAIALGYLAWRFYKPIRLGENGITRAIFLFLTCFFAGRLWLAARSIMELSGHNMDLLLFWSGRAVTAAGMIAASIYFAWVVLKHPPDEAEKGEPDGEQ